MSNLKENDKVKLESLLQMGGGYVLDFSTPGFHRFIMNTVQLDIDNSKYATYGISKAKLLRRFWEIESDAIVGKVIEELLSTLEAKSAVSPEKFPINKKIFDDSLETALTMQGKASQKNKKENNESDFLKVEVDEIPISALVTDGSLINILEQRVVEVKQCLNSGASLAVVFLCGSVLEGLLLSLATSNSKNFNESKSSPVDSSGKVRKFHEWTLSNFIDVAHDLKILGLDVKKHSHALRDFRNYIHPYQQMSTNFTPDKHTAKISWQVLKAAMHDIKIRKN